MSGGFEHLLDPLTGGGFLTSLLPMLMEMGQQRAMQSDPNLLALINNQVNDYNSVNAYDPSTGRFQAGNPFGDAASGQGGAFGHDRSGNPLSAAQAFTRYGLEQVQGSQSNLDQGRNNLSNLAAAAGGNVVAPGGFSLDVPQGLDPGAVQGVDQSTRTPPTPLRQVQAPADPLGDFIGSIGRGFENFVGSFAVGTTSVPRTGLAQVHQGEMIVPAEQNPLADGPPRPMAVRANQMPMPAPMQPGAPASTAGTAMPHSPGGSPGAPQYMPMTPGLSPQVQQQLVSRGREGIDAQAAATMRQMRNSAPAGGGGGALERRMFDAEIARGAQIANLQRDVGLEASNRQFTDTLAANNFELQKYLQSGQLGVSQGQLALQGELGRGQLAQGQDRLNLDRDLGMGQLGVSQGQLALQGELGRGQLGVSQGQLANDTYLSRLQNDIQRGQLGQGQQSLNLQGELGRGQLSNDTFLAQLQQEIQRGQLGQGQQSLDLQDFIQRGQLGQGQQQLDLQGEIQRGQLSQGNRALNMQQAMEGRRLNLDSEIQRGQLGVQQGQLSNDTFLAQLQRELGLGQLGQGQQQLDLQGEIQRGQLGQGQQQLDLQGELGRGNLANDTYLAQLQRELGMGNLANDSRGLDIQQLLGQGQLDSQNRQFDANYSRDLNNDAFGQYQYGQDRNDTLMRQQFEQQLLSGQQNQFTELMRLLAQYGGQAA